MAFHRWKTLHELTLVFGNLPRRCGTAGRPESHPQQTVSGLSKISHRDPELHVSYSNGENDRGSPTDFVPSTPLVSPSSGPHRCASFLVASISQHHCKVEVCDVAPSTASTSRCATTELTSDNRMASHTLVTLLLHITVTDNTKQSRNKCRHFAL